MIVKRRLPFRHSREGYAPDRIHLRFCQTSADETERELIRTQKTAHYHLSSNGTVTDFAPLSAAANRLSPLFPEGMAEVSPARRGILILIEGKELNREQKQPLIRLLKGIQKEVFRIYGFPFPFRRDAFFAEGGLPVEELLEEGYLPREDRKLYRVQTGCYRSRREAEERIEGLSTAGIAAYITEINYGSVPLGE